MRYISYLGLAGLAGSLILTASIAVEPGANTALSVHRLPIIPDELLSPNRPVDDQALPISAWLDETKKPTTDRPAEDQVLELYLKLVEQGLTKHATALQPKQALIVLAALKTRIEKLQASAAEHPAFDKKAPTTLDDFEKLFWSIHVLSNQLTSATRFADHALVLKTTAKKYQTKKNDTTDLTILQVDWNSYKAELADLREKLTIRDRDWRVTRLKLADKVLTDSTDVADRLLAALALDLDVEVLQKVLAKDKAFATDNTQQLKETIDHARKAAGPELIQKSRWLFTGLHWWVRGRYGVGTSGGGFLKDAAALSSPSAMFGLMMPINQPEPKAPSAKEPVPLVDRRHHYLWRFETRQISGGGEVKVSSDFVHVAGSVTTMTHFY